MHLCWVAVQVIGLGWPNYWKVMWNKFDCCLLVTGVVDMALTLAIGEQPHAGLDGCVQDTNPCKPPCWDKENFLPHVHTALASLAANHQQYTPYNPSLSPVSAGLCRCRSQRGQLPQDPEDHAPAAIGTRGQADAQHEGVCVGCVGVWGELVLQLSRVKMRGAHTPGDIVNLFQLAGCFLPRAGSAHAVANLHCSLSPLLPHVCPRVTLPGDGHMHVCVVPAVCCRA